MNAGLKVLTAIAGGLILSYLTSAVGAFAFLSASEPGEIPGGAATWITFALGWVLTIYFVVKSPTIAKAWRKIFIACGVTCFLLPIGGMLSTASFMGKIDSSSANATAEAAGTLIGGGLVSGALGFIGFFLGAVFLVVGLLIGRDKQVVYVQAPQPAHGPSATGEEVTDPR